MMIYFDNAATSKDKPEEVYEAVNYYLREVGVSPGRGSYSIAIQASRMLYKSRVAVGKYFGASNPDRVIFTKNSTEAINMFFRGFLNRGDHVVISCYEHNAVLRPLQEMKDNGQIQYSVISRADLELPVKEIIDKYCKDNTRLFVMTLASNLTGRIVFHSDLFRGVKERGISTFVDSSQGAGKISLNMKEQGIDYLAFTGHKDLLAIPGVGGLVCEADENIRPLLQGGTGVHGEEYVNPHIFPEGYEAGTLNMPAIWGLFTSLQYLNEHKNDLQNREEDLKLYLKRRLDTVKHIVVYDYEYERVSTFSITSRIMPSDKLVAYLDENGICVRGGIHCAILAHEAIGTVTTGTVRISLGYKNTFEEIDYLIDVLKRIGE